MTKEQVDRHFQENWKAIQAAIRDNAPKCATANRTDITSDIYLICIEKANKIENISGYIRILASNIYRWERSSFNEQNRIISNTIEFPTMYSEDNTEADEVSQNRLFALEMYKKNAEPHELVFYDVYMNKGITSVRGLVKHLDVTFRGAIILINDFKRKVKDYERKTQS
jgi:hypothetical protein